MTKSQNCVQTFYFSVALRFGIDFPFAHLLELSRIGETMRNQLYHVMYV